MHKTAVLGTVPALLAGAYFIVACAMLCPTGGAFVCVIAAAIAAGGPEYAGNSSAKTHILTMAAIAYCGCAAYFGGATFADAFLHFICTA
jgi:hypothetical protein